MVSLGTVNGIAELTLQECYRLLPTMPVGRIVFTDHALPAILPVNFAMDGEEIAFRTAEGSKLAMAVSHTVVAFEVDAFDAEARNGWSVVVVGRSHEVKDPAERQRIFDLPLSSFAPSTHDRVVKIVPSIVTGRRITGS